VNPYWGFPTIVFEVQEDGSLTPAGGVDSTTVVDFTIHFYYNTFFKE
jgi:hypothetical protein